VTVLALVLILFALATFVAGQIFLKHAMESTTKTAFPKSSVAIQLGAGILLMTISFFITLGLLQRFDLSYLYPFQGLSVVIISVIAALVLKEKLSWRLMIGALLITAGVVLVSIS
jgi:drug/metabolite transporter (DMT)-like permease